MQKPLLQLLVLSLVVQLSNSALLHAASGKKLNVSSADAAKEQFELTVERAWPRGAPAELAGALDVYRLAKVRQASNEELQVLDSTIRRIEERMPYLLTIRSAGGPLSAFVRAAAKLDGISFELVNAAEPSDLETPLPQFNLRNANWGTVISVLESFLAPRGLALKFAGGDTMNLAEAKSVVCVLEHVGPPQGSSGATDGFLSYQLEENLFEGQSVQVIVDAIRAAWELDPSHDPAALRIKFHPGTKLLLVNGPGAAPRIADQVLHGLKKNRDLRH
jgi:hypothetical protein